MSAHPDESQLAVAFDAGPLLEALTGVGVAVQCMAAALEQRGDIRLQRYACSFRGSLQPGMTRLPLPAAVAMRLWSASSSPRVDHWLRPAQVIHGTNYTVPPSRLPRIVSVYDCWFLRHPQQASGDVTRAAKVLRRAVATGAVVHASSQATADAVRELLGAERVEVIPLAAVPTPSTPPGDRDSGLSAAGRLPSGTAACDAPVAELVDVPFVLALGTLERRKNLPRLVAAFGRIESVHPELRLVLAGADGDDRANIDDAIDLLPPGARSRVMLTGRIDPAAKRWLLGQARLLAYPSLDEGFGFPLLEAMQNRVPVVASTAGSIPEVAGGAALLVAADDVDGLAAAMDLVVSNESQRDRLITAGVERLAQFSWVHTAQGLANLYRRVVREGT